MNNQRPYLIIPKLIVQPTWGGGYIAGLKGWNNLPGLEDKKIGQSYELFSGSKLLIEISDTSDPLFLPEIGSPDSSEIEKGNALTEGEDYINITDLGEYMPLLIKFTQSLGNSFQLHIKPGQPDARWKPKAESWYYFEPGYLTYGIKKGINLEDYKSTCLKIESYMKSLCEKIKIEGLEIDRAREMVKAFIAENDPHQFVNLYKSAKNEVVDPSRGGIHHSWEEDSSEFPLGNVLYEIQEDVMDPSCTIRSFDQGKIKPDGSVREIHIDDYFKYMDASDEANDITLSKQKAAGECVLSTRVYSMDVINIQAERTFETGEKFNHLFVKEGSVEVSTSEKSVRVGKGHSCFIPNGAEEYSIKPIKGEVLVLKTYLTS